MRGTDWCTKELAVEQAYDVLQKAASPRTFLAAFRVRQLSGIQTTDTILVFHAKGGASNSRDRQPSTASVRGFPSLRLLYRATMEPCGGVELTNMALSILSLRHALPRPIYLLFSAVFCRLPIPFPLICPVLWEDGLILLRTARATEVTRQKQPADERTGARQVQQTFTGASLHSETPSQEVNRASPG